jgi:alkylation response protein AidB-like acyl-CoA dehydrogenase
MSDQARTVVESAIERLLEECPPGQTDPVIFLRAQFDAGLAYVWFPPGYGGLGQPVDIQSYVDERMSSAGAPPSGRVTNAIAAGQGAASILAYGQDELKHRCLRPLFTGEMMGCQLYSEPGSGSDLASLATRAERHGEEWIVNGQKVWTSAGDHADIAILLARTNPDAPKHAGLTQFVLDMHDPGVEVRPLRQMTGGAEFNEVFLTDVRVPDSHRLGEVNEGWAVSQHTLVHERYNMPRVPNRGEGHIAGAVAAWNARPDKTSPGARAVRAELMHHYVQTEVLRLLQMRAAVLRANGTSGAEGSLGKLAASIAGRRLTEWAPAIVGPDAMLLPEGYGDGAVGSGRMRWSRRSISMGCVASPAGAIAGGTDQIQRNIIGDRVLGLPREPAADRGVAWSQTLRN